MEFQVPQFIEVEDKIFGPFSFKQFIYLFGGAGLIFIIYVSMPLYIAIFLIVPVGVFAAALAFYKVNDRPFILVVESAFKYAFSHKLFIWKKTPKKKSKKKEEVKKEGFIVPRLSDSKLRDLSWSLDIKEHT